MAKAASNKITFGRGVNKRTSIGHAKSSRPKNKHARRQYKVSRGQG